MIIPARWGSTRFPGKPLHPIAGKPLLQRVWERCRRARCAESVIVATDDVRIAEAAFDFGAEVALTSASHPSGTDRVAEVARGLRGFTHVINVQGDEPLVAPSLIDRLARELETSGLPMVTAASPIDAESAYNANCVKVVTDRSGNALYFSRSLIPFPRSAQPGKPPRYLRHHGIYGFTRAFLQRFVSWPPSPLEKMEQLEQLRALENGAKLRVILARHPAPGVDTPADVPAVEALLARAKR